MTATMPDQRVASQGQDGFTRILLAEWTKLRTVPRWGLTLLAAVLLTILIALLTAVGSHFSSEGPGGVSIPPPTTFQDQGYFVFKPLSGDGSITARVVSQDNSGDWAKAGVMIRQGATPGSSYAAMMVTPGHGVRLQSDFSKDLKGSSGPAPRWLRLTRTGKSVTGYESANGSDWARIGAVRLDALEPTVEVGMFVASPDQTQIKRQFGGESIQGLSTQGRAVFDNVGTTAAQPQSSAPWQQRNRSMPPSRGSSSEAGGVFTVIGSGDVGPFKFGDDIARRSLSGVLAGLMALVALGVLSITSEYKRGMIRSTFTAGPRRGRVLAAKAVVLGATTFVAGLVASFGAFLLANPILHSNGFTAPSLSDGPVLRAIVGTAALMAVVAVLALGVGVILRHSAGAITVVVLLLFVPQILASGLPLSAALWLGRITPAAGFAIQQTVERYDSAISPWAGFGVLCAYTAAALAAAYWLLRRRDA
ncbi:ABC transporter permease subunit [Pseudonocardia sp.]|uniref:ABC transporter permease subunit n=1 Tax=Pseudonocardia sp. TaxID=60912 RepID=UPI0031FD05C4